MSASRLPLGPDASMQQSTDAIEIDGIRKIASDRTAHSVAFIGSDTSFVLAEEAVLFALADGSERCISLHEGAILCSASAGSRLITGGDDGRIVASDASGAVESLHADENGRWIDHVAATPTGAVAWSIGRRIYLRVPDGDERSIEVSSSVGGLAFSPDFAELAVAHYNGVTLWAPDGDKRPAQLAWKGSHLQVTFSPDREVLVTAMREPTLHAWNLRTATDLPMPGFPTRVRSMGWTRDGRFLATSGSDRLTLLSFRTDDNPLARMPLLLAPYSSLVAAVACHPHKDIVAVGYEDGLVLLVRIPDGAEIIIKAPDMSTVTAMTWDPAGLRIAIASENGQCRIVSIR